MNEGKNRVKNNNNKEMSFTQNSSVVNHTESKTYSNNKINQLICHVQVYFITRSKKPKMFFIFFRFGKLFQFYYAQNTKLPSGFRTRNKETKKIKRKKFPPHNFPTIKILFLRRSVFFIIQFTTYATCDE